MQLTQRELVIIFVEQWGSITPAVMVGKIYLGQMFGSETAKRCRELRAKGILDSKPDGRFERFFLKKPEPVERAEPKPVEPAKQTALFEIKRKYY